MQMLYWPGVRSLGTPPKCTPSSVVPSGTRHCTFEGSAGYGAARRFSRQRNDSPVTRKKMPSKLWPSAANVIEKLPWSTLRSPRPPSNQTPSTLLLTMAPWKMPPFEYTPYKVLPRTHV